MFVMVEIEPLKTFERLFDFVVVL